MWRASLRRRYVLWVPRPAELFAKWPKDRDPWYGKVNVEHSRALIESLCDVYNGVDADRELLAQDLHTAALRFGYSIAYEWPATAGELKSALEKLESLADEACRVAMQITSLADPVRLIMDTKESNYLTSSQIDVVEAARTFLQQPVLTYYCSSSLVDALAAIKDASEVSLARLSADPPRTIAAHEADTQDIERDSFVAALKLIYERATGTPAYPTDGGGNRRLTHPHHFVQFVHCGWRLSGRSGPPMLRGIRKALKRAPSWVPAKGEA